jgi:S-adenosylmethionine:tRNA ribosyltransferase-isomerase
MRLEEFSYHLPEGSIAQSPAPARGASRLLVTSRRDGAAAIHTTFENLPEFLRAGDLVVANRSRVVPARLIARRDDGLEAEVLFLRALPERRFVAWARPLRKLRPGDSFQVGAGARIRCLERLGEREALFEVESAEAGVFDLLDRCGHVPLPPYIRRADRSEDRERYQTVFAREPGSVAAPTAGLHFDRPLLDRLAGRGVAVASLVLHVGVGTFAPLEHEQVEENRLHAEPFSIDADTIAAVASARAEGRRVVAVGTTATRALEAAAAWGWFDEPPADRAGETDLFIRPGYEFRVVDALLTNFHLPRSSLLVLVCAFMGTDHALREYAGAVAGGYRFFSYGDAMLIV